MEPRLGFQTLAAVRAANTISRRQVLATRFLSTAKPRSTTTSTIPRPRAPWHLPKGGESSSATSTQDSKVRSWDSLLPPRPPKGDNSFKEPARSPLLAGRRKELFESDDPTSVYGLMAHDMGLEDYSLFSEGDFLSRHGKAAKSPEMRLRPSTGRIVKVHEKMDFARGLKQLDHLVKANNIRRDLTKQKFHERPGLKRKRQKSERWIQRFRKGFQATVLRVNELRSQGW